MTQITKKVPLKVKEDKIFLSKIFFYRGDGGITLELSVDYWDYQIKAYTKLEINSANMQARLLIKDPKGAEKTIENVTIQNDSVLFVVDKTLTNVVGLHEVYLQIMSSDDNGRTTLPHFEYEVKSLPFNVIDKEYPRLS